MNTVPAFALATIPLSGVMSISSISVAAYDRTHSEAYSTNPFVLFSHWNINLIAQNDRNYIGKDPTACENQKNSCDATKIRDSAQTKTYGTRTKCWARYKDKKYL